MDKVFIKFKLNGKKIVDYVDPRWSLLDLIRGGVNKHTGTKQGCNLGECGACTVIIDNETYNSCIYLAVWVDGKEVRTIEGLTGATGELSDIQQAFIDEAAVQCGFCTPGFIMSALNLLESGKEYTRDEIREAISGNYCRCTGYENIINAIEKTMLRRLGKEV